MASFSSISFNTANFSVVSFDFGSGPPPPVVNPSGNTPGYRRNLRGMKAQVRGEDDDEKYKRRLAMGIITEGPPPEPPKKKRNGLKMARWKGR